MFFDVKSFSKAVCCDRNAFGHLFAVLNDPKFFQ